MSKKNDYEEQTFDPKAYQDRVDKVVDKMYSEAQDKVEFVERKKHEVQSMVARLRIKATNTNVPAAQVS